MIEGQDSTVSQDDSQIEQVYERLNLPAAKKLSTRTHRHPLVPIPAMVRIDIAGLRIYHELAGEPVAAFLCILSSRPRVLA
jgi:hypothetical protein